MGLILRVKRMGRLATLMILSLTFSLTIFNASILQYKGTAQSTKAFNKMFDMNKTYLFNIDVDNDDTKESYDKVIGSFNKNKMGLYNKLDMLKEKGLITNKFIYSPSDFDMSMYHYGDIGEDVELKIKLNKHIVVDYELSKKMNIKMKQGRFFEKEDFQRNWTDQETVPVIVGWKFSDKGTSKIPKIGDIISKEILSEDEKTKELIRKPVFCEIIGIYDESEIPAIGFERTMNMEKGYLTGYFEDTFALYPLVVDSKGEALINLDESFSRFGVFLELKDGVTPEMVIDEIEALAGEGVKGNFYSLKSSITSLMESTALDGNASIVLGIILIILSLIGAISMMMGHLLKRKNEIGVKQSIGASNLIIYKEIFKDMFFVTLTSNILSLYGAFMITKYILPGWLILMNIGIAISLGILITILPVRGILKIQIVDLLRRKG